MADSVRISLRVLGESVAAEVPRPPASMPIAGVLPFLYQLDDATIDVSARRAVADRGEPISCAKGCSNCCRAQPVPVTPVEAVALAKLVDRLPEPRRTEVRAAFAANAARLQDAGLAEVYLDRDRNVSEEEAGEIVRRYFALGLVCPFLVDDACGIYRDRPFVCRQYLVTSPVELCANPLENPVRPVPTLIGFAHAMLATSETLLGRPQRTVPLALALEFAARFGSEYDVEFPSERVFRDAVSRLTS